MLKSKPWDWDVANAAWWEEPAGDVYPLINRWKKQGFKKILDLGCGVGRHSILFAKEGFEVSALDLGEEGLEKLKKIAEKEKLPIKIEHADMIFLPYDNSSFDCLLAYHVIFHQDDEGIEKVIKEIKRVLKKGGEAFITFNSKNSTSYLSKDVKRITENTVIREKGYEAGIPHYHADKKDVERLLKGFEVLEFSYLEQYYPDFTGAHYFVLVRK
jgi:ubiquinone/menaquinone biosynthesis C-methylase UbiE